MTTVPNNGLKAVLARYPGLEIESPIQGYAFLRAFQEGVNAYLQLQAPTPQDDRWAGVCYFHLLDDMRAVELFYRSIARGNEAARINLAHSLAYIERSEDIPDELAAINVQTLKPYDTVLYLRIKSMHAEANSDLKTALSDVTEAWRIASSENSAAPIRAEILSQLAIVESRVGRGLEALRHIEQAHDLAPSESKTALTIVGLNLQLELGRSRDVLESLDGLFRDPTLTEAMRASALVIKGMARWTQDDVPKAIQVFQEAAALSYSLGLSFEQFSSHLGLATLFTYRGEQQSAAQHFAKAENLIGDRSDSLLFRHRDVVARFMAGDYSANSAIMELEAFIDELSDIGAHNDAAKVRLHLAHIQWRLGFVDVDIQLEQVALQVASSRYAGFLAREWVLMPDFKVYASADFNSLLQVEESLKIRSIGASQIVHSGILVPFNSPRAPAVLAYLIDQGAAYLDDIINAVFADMNSAEARAAYSLFRKDLPKSIPGLAVQIADESGLHRLLLNRAISWDVQSVRDGTFEPPAGEFLPGLDSPWINLIRTELQAIRVKAEKSASTL